LYVELESKKDLSGIDRAKVDTEIQRLANSLEILSVEMYGPAYRREFYAGEPIYVNVVVKNRGNYEAEDVYVRLAINELGISRTVYLGDLVPSDYDEEEDTKEITVALQLPKEVKSKNYLLEISAFNSKIETDTLSNIFVGSSAYNEQPSPTSEESIEISVQTPSNKIEQGKGAVYSLVVTNPSQRTENFVIETSGTEGWATSTITPNTFQLAPGQSKIVNLYLVANENAVEGTHVFSVKVKSSNDYRTHNLTAEIIKTSGSLNWKNILMVVGIVLAVIIIVLLVTLITITSKKKPTAESYY
jgi:hypothetical protein